MSAAAGVDDDRLHSNIPSSKDVEASELWSAIGIDEGEVQSSLTRTSDDSSMVCSAS